MSRKHVAVYLGSFDPVTFGHLDVIERASKLFDHLVVGVGRNSNKKFCFSADERFQMVKKECGRFENVEVTKNAVCVRPIEHHWESLYIPNKSMKTDQKEVMN